MANRFDELFFKNDSSATRDLDKKINGRYYALNVLFSVIIMSLILAGIFCSSFIDSIISLTGLGIITVMSAMEYE
ncbi:MAG: hypothetical protein K0S27_1598 [Gammaproteobacteria bacterium]|jgi:hypothetical protein|nr:hypothetical protein [Gammaproteobacteria bacterium]